MFGVQMRIFSTKQTKLTIKTPLVCYFYDFKGDGILILKIYKAATPALIF
jgi:hypothetical protein